MHRGAPLVLRPGLARSLGVRVGGGATREGGYVLGWTWRDAGHATRGPAPRLGRTRGLEGGGGGENDVRGRRCVGLDMFEVAFMACKWKPRYPVRVMIWV